MNQLTELFKDLFMFGTDNLVAGVAFKITAVVLVVYYVVTFIKRNQVKSSDVYSDNHSTPSTSSGFVRETPPSTEVQPNNSITAQQEEESRGDRAVAYALMNMAFKDPSDRHLRTMRGYSVEQLYQYLSDIMIHANDIYDAVRNTDESEVIVSGIVVKIDRNQAIMDLGEAPRLVINIGQIPQISNPLGFRGIVDDGNILSIDAFHDTSL